MFKKSKQPSSTEYILLVAVLATVLFKFKDDYFRHSEKKKYQEDFYYRYYDYTPPGFYMDRR